MKIRIRLGDTKENNFPNVCSIRVGDIVVLKFATLNVDWFHETSPKLTIYMKFVLCRLCLIRNPEDSL